MKRKKNLKRRRKEMNKKVEVSSKIVAGLCMLVFMGINLMAAVPAMINFSGRLADSNNIPITGDKQFTFSVYSADTGGTQLPSGNPWSETQTVSVVNGVYNIRVGVVTPVPESVFDGNLKWLQVSVAGESFNQRMPLVSVPYAYYANKTELAYGVIGDTVTAGNIKDGTIADADISASAAVSISKLAASGSLGANVVCSSVAINSITDNQVAGLSTSKLSGPVTNITSNGLGMLATKDAVATTDINNNAITPVKISTGNYEHIRAGTATVAVSATTAAQATQVAATGVSAGTLGNAVIASSISLNSIWSQQVVDGTIADTDISFNYALSATKGGPASGVAASTVTSANIVDGTIVDADVNATAAISISKLALTGALGNAVICSSVAGSAIGTAQLRDSAITNSKILDGTIASAKLATAYLPLAGGTLTGDMVVNNLTIAHPYQFVLNTETGGSKMRIVSGSNDTFFFGFNSFYNDVDSYNKRSWRIQVCTIDDNQWDNFRIEHASKCVAGTGTQNSWVMPFCINGASGYLSLAGSYASAYRLELPNIASASGQGMANAWSTYSSIRYKKNVMKIDMPLEKIKQLTGVNYYWKENNKYDMGLIAEDVGKIIPEIVDFEEDGKFAKGLKYDRLVALLIESVKEQQKQIEELKQKVTTLEQKK
jgi:hypothetical protein